MEGRIQVDGKVIDKAGTNVDVEAQIVKPVKNILMSVEVA